MLYFSGYRLYFYTEICENTVETLNDRKSIIENASETKLILK